MWLAELSARSGVAVSSIKFYLRSGLLAPGTREPGRRADYDESHVDRLRAIRRLVDAGITLERVQEILAEDTSDEGFASASSLLGRRWMLDVLRVLARDTPRFVDLRRALPQVSPTVLTQRLRELEQAGVVRRERWRPPAAVTVYRLTDRGAGLLPVVAILESWSRAIRSRAS